MPEITTMDESSRRKNPLQVTKYSQAKLPRQKAHPQVVKYYILRDSTQFRSLVQKLTGQTGHSHVIRSRFDSVENSQGSITYESSRPREIKAYYDDMKELCRKLSSKRPCPMEYDFVGVSSECLDCLACCTVFPKGYEITGDTLVQLWMAAGFINEEPMEDIGDAYLRALRDFDKVISFSREDQSSGKIWFQVNDFQLPEELQDMSKMLLVRQDNAYHEPAVGKNKPCHATIQSLPRSYSSEKLEKFPEIRGVLLLRDHNDNIDSLPYDLFMRMEQLQVLDLSKTKVTELPSSIGNAKHLRYLDLSQTPIKRLPETIDAVQNLQTLKLRNCPCLIALPKGTKYLTSLRHLDLGGTISRLRSMPPGIGALTNIRTLSSFIVGQESGCRIGELKNMIHLGGKLCLSRLERITRTNEADEARLSSKQSLTKLQLQWTDDREQESVENHLEDKVIEHLRPHTNLQELRILCYGGSMFPSWMSDPCFNKLVNVTLFKCENCQLLPSLGKLPELLSLSLIELPGVKIIDFRFCRDESAEGAQFHAFPKLQKLTIRSMVNLKEWRDMKEHDFTRLAKLTIKDCPEVAALCRLSDFCSLEYLEINYCAKLSGFQEGDLPKSVKTVVADSCPMLSLNCLMEDAKVWEKIEHGPSLMMCHREKGYR